MATDIAARGIDVSKISHVINYDIPATTDAYIHRIGRTGRAARSGDAVTLVAREDMIIVRSIERVLGNPIERRLVEGFDYNVAAPKKDVEFARPPRPPQQRRKPADGAPKSAPKTPQAAKPQVAHEKVAPTGNQPPKHRNNRSQRGH